MKASLTLLSTFLCVFLFAQGNELPFQFDVLNESYTELENPTVLSTEPWDDPSYEIPLGFEFEFLGSTGTSLYISNLFLGGALGFTDEFINPQDLMIVYGSDIVDAGFLGEESISTIAYEVTGEPGSRIAKIEWKDCAFYNELFDLGTTNNRVSFQCWIYEADDSFDIRFGNHSIKSPEVVHDNGGLFLGFIDNIDIYTNELNDGWLLGGAVLNPSVTNISTVDEAESAGAFEFDPYWGVVYRFTPQSTTNIINAPSIAEISIYPNPVTDILNISAPEGKSIQNIVLYDINGKIMFKSNEYRNFQSIDATNFARGIYFVRIEGEDFIETKKVLLSR